MHLKTDSKITYFLQKVSSLLGAWQHRPPPGALLLDSTGGQPPNFHSCPGTDLPPSISVPGLPEYCSAWKKYPSCATDRVRISSASVIDAAVDTCLCRSTSGLSAGRIHITVCIIDVRTLVIVERERRTAAKKRTRLTNDSHPIYITVSDRFRHRRAESVNHLV